MKIIIGTVIALVVGSMAKGLVRTANTRVGAVDKSFPMANIGNAIECIFCLVTECMMGDDSYISHMLESLSQLEEDTTEDREHELNVICDSLQTAYTCYGSKCATKCADYEQYVVYECDFVKQVYCSNMTCPKLEL